jgi:tetratricopeptide (TPR) repeat protein
MDCRHYKLVYYGIYCCIMSLFLSSMTCRAQSGLEELRQYWYYPDASFTMLLSDTNVIKEKLRIADSTVYQLPDKSRILALQALDKSIQLGFLFGAAHSLNTLGSCYIQKGMYDSAIFFFRKALVYTQQLNYGPGLFRVYSNLAESYFYNGNYEASIENYDQVIAVLKKDSALFPIKKLITAYCNTGLIWLSLNAADQALIVFKKANDLAEKSGDSMMTAPIAARIGGALLFKKKYKQAESYYLRAIKIAKVYKQQHFEVETANSLAHLYIAQGRLEEAKTYTLEALHLLDELAKKNGPGKGNYDRLHAEHNLGVIYLQKHQLDKAAPLLLKAFSVAKASGLKDLIPHMEPDVAAFFAAKGEYKKAYDHIRHYALLRDTLLEQQKDKALSNWMQARINEKDKAMLSQKLEITQQQKKLQAKNFWIGGTAFGSLLLLTASLAFLRSYKNRQRLQQAAFGRLQQEQEINQLKAQVRGEEQERNRIAMELHDGIASQLWAIKLNVDSLQQQHQLNGVFQHNLHTIYQQLDDTAQEVRKTAHNLMPDLLLE